MHRIPSRTLGIAGLLLLSASGLSWAGPPDPTPSDGVLNTAGGGGALSHVTTGYWNTGFGAYALLNNTTGYQNSAFGTDALIENTTGHSNSAFGAGALNNNITGGSNTAGGVYALYYNTTGEGNSAFGTQALYNNTTGTSNTAGGFFAMSSNRTGSRNTVLGSDALTGNTTGSENTALGSDALAYQTKGSENTAVGTLTLAHNVDGSNNTAVGSHADVRAGGTYTNGTVLGSNATLFASNSIVLGDGKISAIYANVTTITGISDRRRKKDVRALDTGLGLDFIEKLKPVSYRFNNGDETERYGFIAQDLEQALPVSLHETIERSEPEHGLALIERQNDKDRTYRISYGELFAPIVKAIQQQQQEIADMRRALRGQAAALKAENDVLRHSIEALRKQQVSAVR